MSDARAVRYKAVVEDLLMMGNPGPDDTLELLAQDFEVMADTRSTADRPGFSRGLADEMARQIIAGTADYERFKAVAPHHDANLWERHDFEGRFTWDGLWPRLQDLAVGRQGVHLFAVVGTYAVPACWTALQVFERDGRVSVVLFQRSCDVWRGFPYDLAMLQAVWRHLAGDKPLGECHWFIGSLHLYERDEVAAREWCDADA